MLIETTKIIQRIRIITWVRNDYVITGVKTEHKMEITSPGAVCVHFVPELPDLDLICLLMEI